MANKDEEAKAKVIQDRSDVNTFLFAFCKSDEEKSKLGTLASRIDVGQGINVGPGKFGKKNKRRALNKHWALEC